MPSFEEFPNNPLSFAPLPLGHNGIRKGRSAKLKGGRQLQPASSAPQRPSEQHLGHLGEPLRVPGAGQAGRVLTVQASTDGGCRLFAPLENQAHKGTGGCRGASVFTFRPFHLSGRRGQWLWVQLEKAILMKRTKEQSTGDNPSSPRLAGNRPTVASGIRSVSSCQTTISQQYYA